MSHEFRNSLCKSIGRNHNKKELKVPSLLKNLQFSTSSICHLTIYRPLPKMDLRIDNFILKLIYTENFMTLGLSRARVTAF